MVAFLGFVVWVLSFFPIYSQELSKQYLNIGVILEPKDDISGKVISLAIQNANIELTKFNYVLQAKTEILESNSSFYSIRKTCDLLQNGLVAIISPISSVPSRHISSLCSKFHIPHLVTSCRFPESLENYPMDIKMSPNCDQYAKIIYHFITKIQSWKDMIFIHSSDNCILKFEHLLNQFESRFRMSKWVHNDLEKNKELLRELETSKRYRYFLVDIPYWQITDFLIMVSFHNLAEPRNSFIFTDWDANLVDITAFKINNKMNITTFSIVNSEMVKQMIKTYNNFESLRESIMETEKFTKPSYKVKKFLVKPAILFDSINLLTKGLIKLVKTLPLSIKPIECSSNETWNQGRSLFDAISSVDGLSGITGRLIFNKNAQRKDYNVSIMELTETGFEKRGFWSEDKFTILPRQKESVNVKVVNTGKSYRVTTIQTKPFVFYRDGDNIPQNYDTSIDAWNGFCIDLLKLIGKDLKLDFTIHLVKDGKYGQPITNETNPDGSEKWSGMIGELLAKQAELAVAPLTISHEREKVVDFTTPFMSFGLSILFLKPAEADPGLFSFLSPFSAQVWIYIIIAYIGVSIMVFFIAHLTPYEWKKTHTCDGNSKSTNQFDLLNSFWFPSGALVRQDLRFSPQATSTRMVYGFWWLFMLFIICIYIANLFAFFNIKQLILPIKSAEDLFNQANIKYGTLMGGSSYSYFEKSHYSLYKKMFEYMKRNPDVFVNTIEDGVNKVTESNGKYAFLLESVMNSYYAQRDCNLMQIGDLLNSKGYGIGFPTGSPLRDKMTQSILKLEKSQSIHNLANYWWKEVNITEPCKRETWSGPSTLNVYEVGGLFVLLVASFIMAAIVSTIELYVSYKARQAHLKVSFWKYLEKEFQFARRFGCSSKKSLQQEIPENKSLERLSLLDPQTGMTNDASVEISHPPSNLAGPSESHTSEHAEGFSSSPDALNNITN